MTDFHSIYQQYQLSAIREAYAPAVIDKLITKFKAENTELDEDTIQWYINRFDALKGSPRLHSFVQRVYKIDTPADIFKYNWQQLETVVDQQPAPDDHPSRRSTQSSVETDAKLLWDKNKLKIYSAPSAEACIQLGQYEFGRPYTFCISRDMQKSNMYDSYRYQNRSFYFVYDSGKPQTDPYHLLVIQATTDPDIFYVTSAPNTGDRAAKWNQIVYMQPKLAGLQHLFKFNKFTPAEENKQKIRQATPNNFDELTYDLKRLYISASKPIRYESWEDLPRDLKALYTDLATDRWIPQFFSQDRISSPESLDIKNLLTRTLPQYVNRYFERIKQRISTTSNDVVTVSSTSYTFTVDINYLKRFQAIYSKNFDLIEYITTDSITPILREHKIENRYNFAIHIEYSRSEKQTNVELVYNHTLRIKCANVEEAIKKSIIITSLNIEDTLREAPEMITDITITEYSQYAWDLLSQIIITNNNLQDHRIKNFVQGMMDLNSLYMTIDTAAERGSIDHRIYANRHFSDIGKSMSKSIAFRAIALNAIQHNKTNSIISKQTARPITDKDHIIGIIVPIIVAHFMTFLMFFDNNFEYQGYYELMNKILGHDISSTVGNIYYNKSAKGNMPKAIKIIKTDNGPMYIEWDIDAYIEEKLAKKTERAARNSGGPSALKRSYKELKSAIDRDSWMKQHGKLIDAVRHNRRTLIPNEWVLTDKYQSGKDVLSTTTYENVETIGKAFNITWNQIFIIPVHTRNAASFVIAGKDKDGNDIFFIRKETAASGAGRTFVYSTKNGEEYSATTLVYRANNNTGGTI